MRRILSMILAVMLLCSLTVPTLLPKGVFA